MVDVVLQRGMYVQESVVDWEVRRLECSGRQGWRTQGQCTTAGDEGVRRGEWGALSVAVKRQAASGTEEQRLAENLEATAKHGSLGC